MKDIYRKTCWYWETYTVNCTFITSDSRSSYRPRKTTWCRYCKIEITRCLLVCEAVDYTIFIHTGTLYWACIFRAMSEFAHGQRKI